jgi:uncharacterized protein YcbX
MAGGTVAGLWRWPVKSLAGEPLEAARFGPSGMAGDRAHAVLDHHKGAWRRLTAKQAPGLLSWTAGYAGDPSDPAAATLTAPDGSRWRWGEPGLAERLGRDLRRPVRLSEPGDHHDVSGTALVTVEATRRAIEEELGRSLDVRRFRPNVHLELDAPAYAELGWIGERVAFDGGVVLRFDHPCDRCAVPTRDPESPGERWPELLRHLERHHHLLFGVRARVEQPGTLRRGEAAELQSSHRA